MHTDNKGYNINVDNTTIEIQSDALQVKNESIGSDKILNNSIAIADLSPPMGATTNGQILKWDQDNTTWTIGSDDTSSTPYTGGDGLTLSAANDFSVNVDNTTIETNTDILRIKDGGVNSDKILNNTIAIEDLSPMGATTNGQVLKWDQDNTTWTIGSDDTSSTPYTGGDGLTLSAANDFSVNVDNTTIETNTDILRIKDGGITNAKLDKVNIPLSGFGNPTADINLNSQKIINLAVPTLDTDAATKKYVDDNAGSNLSNADLTQTAAVRTYEIGSGQSLTFTGAGFLGFGNGANPPLDKFHFAGEVRVEGINSSAGTEGSPAYSFSTSGDTDTGMYRPAADEIGFSVGGNEALHIDEPTTGETNVTVRGSFSTNIRTDNGGGTVTIEGNDHTVIFNNASDIELPAPATTGTGINVGKIYILKNVTGAPITIDPYSDSTGANTTLLGIGVTQLQSDGTTWHQIN